MSITKYFLSASQMHPDPPSYAHLQPEPVHQQVQRAGTAHRGLQGTRMNRREAAGTQRETHLAWVMQTDVRLGVQI